MDALLLWVTAIIRQHKYRFWRIAVAAFIGACYVVLSYVPGSSLFLSMVGKGFVATVFIWIAFGKMNRLTFIKNFSTFLVLNFTLAGGIFAITWWWQTLDPLEIEIGFTTDGSVIYPTPMPSSLALMFVTLLLVVWLVIYYRDLYKRQAITALFLQVKVQVGPHVVSCQGLLDTGNQLYEPLSQAPVMIMEASLWDTILPQNWVSTMQAKDWKWSQEETALEYFWQHRLRIIPYRVVNQKQAFLIGFKPDAIWIDYQEKTYQPSKVIIAIDSGKLSRRDDYQAIVHPDLISTP